MFKIFLFDKRETFLTKYLKHIVLSVSNILFWLDGPIYLNKDLNMSFDVKIVDPLINVGIQT